MNFTVRWKDCQKSDGILNHLQNKMDDFETFHFVLPEGKAEIVFYEKQKKYTARINVSVRSKGVIRAEASAYDVITAINDCADKVTDQLRRVKTQFKDRK